MGRQENVLCKDYKKEIEAALINSTGYSAQEFVIIQDGYKLKLIAPLKERGENWYSLSLDAKCVLLDFNQAYLLMLWLQEHLK